VEFAWSNPNGVLSSATTQSYEYTIPANTPAKTMLIIPIYTWTPSAGVVGGQVHVRLKRIASTGTSPDNNPWCTKLQLNITTVGGQNYVVNGWRRLTDGSNHVLNTDWAEIRTLSGT
jgi:hypothetical protein